MISIISITFIFLIHHLLSFFKSTLTVPKIKDLVNSPNQKYQHIYDTINHKPHKKSNKSDSNFEFNDDSNSKFNTDSSTISNNTENTNMKNELKSFLKNQMNKTNDNDVIGMDSMAYSYLNI